MKRIVSMLPRIGISIVLLYLLFRRMDKAALVEILKNADWGFIGAAFFIFFFSYCLAVFRWRMLLISAKINLPLKRIIISVAGGHFFSLFLPSSIGGDVVRVIDLTTHTKKPHEVMATVLLDRLSGYVGLVLLAWIGLLFGTSILNYKGIIISVVAITVVLIGIMLVLFNKFFYTKINKLLQSPSENKIKHYIRDVHSEIHIFRRHKRVAVNNILVSLAIQVITPITFYLTALSLGLKIDLINFFVFLPLIGVVTMLPISIGGLGLREYMTQLFFANSQVSAHSTFAMSFLNSLFILIYGCLGGLIYVLTVHHRRLQHNPSPAVRKKRK